jgi:hypothetical protein
MAKKNKVNIKSQKEILQNQQKPYIKDRGNPNPKYGGIQDQQTGVNHIRGNKLSFKGDNTKIIKLGLTNINDAVFYYLKNIVKPQVLQNGKNVNVPILYSDGESWKLYRRDGVFRDKEGALQSPIIALKRDNISEKRNIGNKLDANNPLLYTTSQQTHTIKNRYSNFGVLNNRIPNKINYTTVIPDYKIITYSGLIQTYYIEQLDDLIETISYNSGSYWGDPEKYKFKSIIKDFSRRVEMVDGEERLAKSEFKMELHCYIIPDSIQKRLNSSPKFNSKSKITIGMEATYIPDSLDSEYDTLPDGRTIDRF